MTDEGGGDQTVEPLGRPAPQDVAALSLPMLRIVEWGIGLWAVAFALTLTIPALREGPRSWWPWCCVAGMVLGAVGWAYLRRGRGNAAEA